MAPLKDGVKHKGGRIHEGILPPAFWKPFNADHEGAKKKEKNE